MPDLRRYRTRCASLWKREKGAIDQLCAARQQFSPHRHLQDMFMAAMREALCWQILRDEKLAQLCLEAGLNPNGLRNYEDLECLPVHPGVAAEKRQKRRWDRVLKNGLCDLGWSKGRRRQAEHPEQQMACSAGHWHLPRILRYQGARLYCPCSSTLARPAETAVKQGVCACGRSGQWCSQQGVLSL